jgi:uncharacterized damage-inducible protein DinB
MSFRDAYLKEFEFESKSTCKLLERVPGDKFDWAPHEKSMKLGSLANHIVALASRPETVLTLDEIDLQSPAAAALRPPSSTNSKELVERWGKNIATTQKVVGAATDELLDRTYTLKAGDHVIFSLPKRISLRTFVLNHIIHHRGQLSVYLRLLDVPIPSIYGPSADEKI